MIIFFLLQDKTNTIMLWSDICLIVLFNYWSMCIFYYLKSCVIILLNRIWQLYAYIMYLMDHFFEQHANCTEFLDMCCVEIWLSIGLNPAAILSPIRRNRNFGIIKNIIMNQKGATTNASHMHIWLRLSCQSLYEDWWKNTIDVGKYNVYVYVHV